MHAKVDDGFATGCALGISMKWIKLIEEFNMVESGIVTYSESCVGLLLNII